MEICGRFTMLRNYGEEVERILIRGKPDHFEDGPYDGQITAEHFPTRHAGLIVREMLIVCFKKQIAMPDALREFAKERLCPAELGDLLDFRIEHPLSMRGFHLAALGSVCKGHLGYFSAFSRGKCHANLLNIDDRTGNKWADNVRFLAYADTAHMQSPEAKSSGDFYFYISEKNRV